MLCLSNPLHDIEQRVSRYVHVTQDNISIVLFDSHGSTGQDENYFRNSQPNWLERQQNDYIRVAQ